MARFGTKAFAALDWLNPLPEYLYQISQCDCVITYGRSKLFSNIFLDMKIAVARLRRGNSDGGGHKGSRF